MRDSREACGMRAGDVPTTQKQLGDRVGPVRRVLAVKHNSCNKKTQKGISGKGIEV